MADFIIKIAPPPYVAAIQDFCDFWIGGKGFWQKEPGAIEDYPIPAKTHLRYVTKHKTYLMYGLSEIVGWAVQKKDGTLIHLVIAGNCRGLGLARMMVEHINPKLIYSRTKPNLPSPTPFYEKLGYSIIETKKVKSNETVHILKKL